MAQLNITLNQEEIQALLLEDSGEAFKTILQSNLVGVGSSQPYGDANESLDKMVY